MWEWVQNNGTVIWWLGAASVITFVLSMVLVPWWAIRIPRDYFSSEQTAHSAPRRHDTGPWRTLAVAARNIVGGAFVLVGISMLVLPGPGLLVMLGGVMLMDLPGKYAIARWLVERGPVLRSINWLRRRAGREPLVFDDDN